MKPKAYMCLVLLSWLLTTCTGILEPSSTPTPAIRITTRDISDIHVEFDYGLVTREQMIEQADIIFTGTVNHLSPTSWNQDSGQYWEIEMAEIVPEEEVVVENGEIPDELRTEGGVRLSTTLSALPLHQITFADVRPIVDSVGLDETVVLIALGNSPADATTRPADHTLQVGDEVIVFARQTEMQWWDGAPPQLLEGQQGSYYEVGQREVLMFANAPDASYLRLGEDGLYHAQYPSLEYDQGPASLDELVSKIAQLRPNDSFMK